MPLSKREHREWQEEQRWEEQRQRREEGWLEEERLEEERLEEEWREGEEERLEEEEERLEEQLRQERRATGFSKASPGDLVVYKRGEFYKMALVDSEDEGYVMSVKHLDGSVEGLREKYKRRVLRRDVITVEPTELLAKVAHLKCETWEELAEKSREFRKDAKVSSEKADTSVDTEKEQVN
jgi:hypothetical protein